MGRPLRGISLQALENRSTTTRIWVNPSELGRSVAKLTPTWDHGRRGVMWRWHRLSIHGQIGRHPRPYWATSTELGGAREYAGCLGVQSPGKHEGAGSLRVATRICSFRAHRMGLRGWLEEELVLEWRAPQERE